ncbi:MAG: succinate dehydrogenase assembly factor 2 family protein [Rickettsiales bacterium]|nr:MAG: succinate dehydrogenase assembly factor 2 family protein [Rickettsiales bacterium]
MNIKNKDQLIKKLLYQSCNRGCKETDLIIGQFARQNLDNMSSDELAIFEKILQLADGDIYDWYTKKKPVPAENKSEIMVQILNFEPAQI